RAAGALAFFRRPVVEGGTGNGSPPSTPLSRLGRLGETPAVLAALGAMVEPIYEAIFEPVDRFRHRLGRHVGPDEVAMDIDEHLGSRPQGSADLRHPQLH